MPAARAQEVLATVVDAVGDHPTVAHCCHVAAPLRLLRACGFDALAVDLTIVGSGRPRSMRIGELVEGGGILLAGVIPDHRCRRKPDAPLRHVGRAAPGHPGTDLGFRREELAGSVVPTPTCGLAGADRDWAVRAMRLCRPTGAMPSRTCPRTW